ncbi:MAG: peptide ABC transporter substrate-binding protein [Beijerinckiaceae bacterium]
MTMFHKHSLFRAAVLASATILSSAAFAQVTFHRGNDGDPETLDVQKTSTVVEAHLTRDMIEGLMIHNAAGVVVPGVAESHTASADGKVYTFKLRANAKWSNGDPVKASDFVYSFRRIMNPETGAKYANILYSMKNAEKINKKDASVKPEDLGVKAIDDRTLEITLERPTPYFLELLTHATGLPVHPASVEKHGKDFVKPENWVSNGAYVLKEWTPNSSIRLEKNPHFHDAANVQIERIIYYPTPDYAAASRRFMAGELQFTTDIPADQVKFLKERLGDQVKIAPYLGTYYLAFNMSKKPFDDVRVRQALSMAMDREFIAEQIWGGTMVPAYSFVPPGIGNYGKPAAAPWAEKSPIEREDDAKKLLAAAGYGPGKPLKVEIRYNTTDNNRRTVVAVADQWKQIGVETTFINTDGKTHFAHLREGGDFDVARVGWIGDYSDPHNFLFLVLSDNKGFNYARYNNPEYDALVKQAENETDLKKRADILFKAEQIFTRDQPYAPVLFYSTKNLVSNKLEGFQSNLRGAYATRFYRLKP